MYIDENVNAPNAVNNRVLCKVKLLEENSKG